MTVADDTVALPRLASAARSWALAWPPSLLVRECLAGVVTMLALLPEVISFSFVSGVDAKVALVASVVLAFVTSVLGGRPAMVTAAAGSVALVIGPMVRAHGVPYVLPTVLLAGVVQVAFGAAGLARMTRFIPRSVMLGFVNALGILIFCAQVPHVIGTDPVVYALFAVTAVITLLLPRLTTAVPAALVAIVAVTAIVAFGHLHVPNVSGDAPAAAGLPGLTPLLVPLDLDTLRIIWPTALSVAFVGLLETLLTARLVDDLTRTPSNKGQECWALGVANILASCWGGIGGCAMIGQSIVNVEIGGGRTRLSTAVAALALLAMLTGLGGLMARIPMVALAAVMMIVAIRTVNWGSIKPETLKRLPVSETAIMLLTVGVTVATGNLALGVLCGVVLAIIVFARRASQGTIAHRTLLGDGDAVRYVVHGPLFFGSSHDLHEHFTHAADPADVTIDLTHSPIWDVSSVAALDAIETKYRDLGSVVTFVGLDERSAAFRQRLSGIL
ncbi:SulP family inorganic anion transporter [Acidisphaera sp. S103]|uniref:SulP family inorganic anion transporter n=1 Tax=Acidisphaera sp. S103 TaxID=1747223 RepID=UPI00131D6EC7|nr:SulP family inorganic anion transporter [Acidisphaera sp. S103]